MAAVRYLFSTAVAVLMFCIDEMEEQPCLLLLLGVEKEENNIVILPQRQQGGKAIPIENLEEAESEIEKLFLDEFVFHFSDRTAH